MNISVNSENRLNIAYVRTLEKIKKNERRIVWAFYMTIFYTLFTTIVKTKAGFDPLKIPTFFLLIFTIAISIISAIYVISKFNIKNVNRGAIILFLIFMIIGMLTFLRGIQLNYDSIKRVLTNTYIGPTYFIPLILIFGMFTVVWEKVIRAIFISNIFGILVTSSLFFVSITSFNSVYAPIRLLANFGFTFLLIPLLSRNLRYLAILSFFFLIVASVAAATRTWLLFAVYFLITYFYLITLYQKKASRKISLLFYVIAIIVLILFSIENYQLVEGTFVERIEFFQEKLPKNTREGMLNKFFNDVSGFDIIFGRGSMGLYYDNGYRSMRESIENGYLHIILKGGIVFLIPYLMLLFYAGWIGLYRSKNYFTKANAIFVISQPYIMFAFGLPCWDLRYFLLWLSVGACLSKKMRNSTTIDDEMRRYFREMKLWSFK